MDFSQGGQYQNITITPLGAGQQVGRSCIIVKIKDRTIIFDTGIHMQYTDMQKYPDFRYICGDGDINQFIDLVVITHFHLDHCGGLPYLTEYFKYSGPIYATMPTKAMIPYMLEDFRKVSSDVKKQTNQNLFSYSATQARWAAQKITSIGLQETVICKGVKITPYYAGHVLGAGMFLVQYQGLSVLYTGDFNSYADRHLGAANAPRLDVNVVITQTTYATTIRDTKRDREQKMLKIVSETVEKGGKVLIPVFALGRAQQLSVLLETYWNRTDNEVPVYFSAGLIQKANFYYKLFVEWENEKIKQDFLTNNLFNFKKVKPFDKSLIRADFPYVLFATPGMLHGGTSLQVFKQWCGNIKNTIIIPGFCVPGTIGNKLITGIKKFEIDQKQYQINMKIQNISFSAHADAKGIINLIRFVNAENIVFVHGDKFKMEIFQNVVKQQLCKPVYRPANKQTIQIPCTIRRQISIKDVHDAKKNKTQPSINGYLFRRTDKHKKSHYKLVDQKYLLRQLNMMQQLLGCTNSIIVQDNIQTILQIDNQHHVNELQNISEEELAKYNLKLSIPKNNRWNNLDEEGEIVDEDNSEEEEQFIKEEDNYKEQYLSKKQQQQKNQNQSNTKIKLQGQLKNVINFLQTIQTK